MSEFAGVGESFMSATFAESGGVSCHRGFDHDFAEWDQWNSGSLSEAFRAS